MSAVQNSLIEAAAQVIYYSVSPASATAPWHKLGCHSRKKFYDTAYRLVKLLEQEQARRALADDPADLEAW